MTNWRSPYSQNTMVSFEYTYWFLAKFFCFLGPTIFQIPQPNWYYGAARDTPGTQSGGFPANYTKSMVFPELQKVTKEWKYSGFALFLPELLTDLIACTIRSLMNKHARLLFSRRNLIVLAVIWGRFIDKQHQILPTCSLNL